MFCYHSSIVNESFPEVLESVDVNYCRMSSAKSIKFHFLVGKKSSNRNENVPNHSQHDGSFHRIHNVLDTIKYCRVCRF